MNSEENIPECNAAANEKPYYDPSGLNTVGNILSGAANFTIFFSNLSSFILFAILCIIVYSSTGNFSNAGVIVLLILTILSCLSSSYNLFKVWSNKNKIEKTIRDGRPCTKDGIVHDN